MGDLLRIACVQLNAGADKAANLETAARLVARAAAGGAEAVLLPETWNAIGEAEVFQANAEPLDGPSFAAMSDWARQLGVTIVGGSVTERREDGRLANTCAVFDPSGERVAVYRKIHMFDVEVGGQVYRESDVVEPGDQPVVCTVEDWLVGLTICYDLRFPELFRVEALDGAELITVPAAFTLVTGKDHWELLLRARAVENQLYVVACNQWGTVAPGKAAYGRSLIVDPWGIVLAAAPDEDCVIAAELDRARLARVRAAIPALANRRPAAYRWPAAV